MFPNVSIETWPVLENLVHQAAVQSSSSVFEAGIVSEGEAPEPGAGASGRRAFRAARLRLREI